MTEEPVRNKIMNVIYLTLFAQAYGTGLYGECAYSDDADCLTTEAPGLPNTGFFYEHPVLSFGLIAIIAVVLYTATLLLFKKLRRKPKG